MIPKKLVPHLMRDEHRFSDRIMLKYQEPMNYRHAYHAGNFADVVKHAVLARILTHLRAKPAAFRVIDTHAGAGLYDLTGDEATRILEWREGIARLRTATMAEPVRALLTPYLDVIAGFNG